MTFRPPILVPKWEPDPTGIARKSQDGVRVNLLLNTLNGKDKIYGAQGESVPRYDWPNPPPPVQPDRYTASGAIVLFTLAHKDTVYGVQGQGVPLYDWPLPKVPLQPDRSYAQTLSYQTLLSQDARLAGIQSADLTNRGPIQPDRSYSLETKLTTFNIIPTPPGTQRDWPLPKSPPQPDRYYAQTIGLTTLFGKDARLVAKQIGELPKVPLQPDRFYAQTINYLTLAGKDAQLVGDQIGQLPAPAVPVALSYTPGSAQLMPLVLPGPVGGPIMGAPIVAGPIMGDPLVIPPSRIFASDTPLPLPVVDRFYSQSITISSVLNTAMPAALRSDSKALALPQSAAQPDRSYTQPFALPGLSTAPIPFAQFDWPLPKSALQPERSWWQALILDTLFGQDAFIVGEQTGELPQRRLEPDRTFAGPLQLQLPAFAFIQSAFGQVEWSVPQYPLQPERSWWQTLVSGTLSGKDARRAVGQVGELPQAPIQPDRSYLQNTPLVSYAFQGSPFAQFDWPVPQTALQPERTWRQTLISGGTLFGQDAVLTGVQLTQDLPKAAAQPERFYARYTALPAFIASPQPFAQFDWPLPKVPFYPVRSNWQNMVAVTLSAQDKKVAGVQSAELTNNGPLQPDRFWNQTLVSATLQSQDASLAGSQIAALAALWRQVQPDASHVQQLITAIISITTIPPPQKPALVISGYPGIPF